MKSHEKAQWQHIIDNFCQAENLVDIAKLLNIAPKALSYTLYKYMGGRENQYTTFEIKKRRGGERTISAPQTGLKEIQCRLNDVLQKVYWEKNCVHSFIKNRSAKTNASMHCNKRYVFNLDLKDFFPTIHFGRVRGLFISSPYSVEPKAATILAQIVCHNGTLPQGAPSSPIISNMICSKMDAELMKLATQNKCYYTRYADDLTFSTNTKHFPKSLCDPTGGKCTVGEELTNIIKKNGFSINESKVKLQQKNERQEVTGLIVNNFVNPRRKLIRQVRAMLHAWDTYGLENAEKEYYKEYNIHPTEHESFKSVVRGKIEFIKHVRDTKRRKLKFEKKDFISEKLLRSFFELEITEHPKPLILTEGPTDWMHLSAALTALKKSGLFTDLNIDFYKNKHPSMTGESNLFFFCQNAQKMRENKEKVICIFDKDVKKITTAHPKGVRKWNNNVISMLLPAPTGYTTTDYSIEMFYGDQFIKSTFDEFGRRLYLSDEFSEDRIHKGKRHVSYGVIPQTGKVISSASGTLKGPKKVIDSLVCKEKDGKFTNIALSKKNFALNILKQEKNFSKADFTEFTKIFSSIESILSSS